MFGCRVVLRIVLIAVLAALPVARASSAQVTVVSDATWKSTDAAPAAGWNGDVSFDDSAWISAFKSPSGNNIWYGSNLSSESPNQAWFRHAFTLDALVASAVGDFFFDDNGENYLNGHLLINDAGGGATTYSGINIDPSWFVIGQNLFAIHGIDTIAPFSNVAASLQITPVPEPATATIPMLIAVNARRRRRCGRSSR